MPGPSGGGRSSCPPLVIGRRFEDHPPKNSGAPCAVGRCSRRTHTGFHRQLGPRPGPHGGAIGARRSVACRDRHHQPFGRGSLVAARQGGVGRGLSRRRHRLQRRPAGRAGHGGQARRWAVVPAHRQRPRGPGAICRCDPRIDLVQWPSGARIHAAARPAEQHAPGHGTGACADRAVDVGCADAAGGGCSRAAPGARRAASGCRSCTVACTHTCAARGSRACTPSGDGGRTGIARWRQCRRVQSAPGRHAL